MAGWDDNTKKENNDAQIKSKTIGKKEESVIQYTDEKIKDWLFGKSEKTFSTVCCAIYGFDGTAKSGIALDCRTDEEKKAGKKIIVFDLDGGCGPLKAIYHDNDPSMIIKNPLVRDSLGNVDYEGTFARLKAAIDYVEKHLTELNVKAIVFDGVDRLLKLCELKMRDDLGKNVEDGIDYRYWKIRNQAYGDIMEQIKLLDVDRFFITHYKKDHDTGEYCPDWEKKTPDMMHQKLRCYREQETIDGNKIIKLKVEIEKCKTNLKLEGKMFTVAETAHGADGKTTAKWNGFIFNDKNEIIQRGNKK